MLISLSSQTLYTQPFSNSQPGQDCVPVQGPLVSLGRLWAPSWDMGGNKLVGFLVPEDTGHGFVYLASTLSFTVKESCF